MKKLTHPRVASIPGEIAVSIDNQLITLVGNVECALNSAQSLTVTEIESSYVPVSNIPVTRVGDMTYLPLDIKGDFKGAIAPWGELPYMLHESDGTLVMLRPGYNGEFQGLFYSYSISGSLETSEFRHTDTAYAPPFLGPHEYISAILNSSNTGFLCLIRSYTDLAVKRFFWIEHNGTLDSKYHTYLDVTVNMSQALPNGLSNSSATATYIPSIAAFVMLSVSGSSKMGMLWYTVNRPFQSSHVSTTAPALPMKDLNWTDLSGVEEGTNNAPILVDASTPEGRSRYFKFLNEPSVPLTTYNIFHEPAGPRRISYTLGPTGQIRFLVLCEMYIAWTNTDMRRSWYVSMEYDPTSNTLAPTVPHADLTLYQSLPYVIDRIVPSVDSSPAPAVVTDQYKANKYPVLDYNYIQSGNVTAAVCLLGETIVVPVVGTTDITAFSTEVFSLDYQGDTIQSKAYEAFGYFAPTQTKMARYVHRSSDASMLSKSLGWVGFVGLNTIRVASESQLYSDAELKTRWLEATVPSISPSSQIYSISSNQHEPSLPAHTTIIERARGERPTATSTCVVGSDPTLHLRVLSQTDSSDFIQYDFDVQGTAQSRISLNEDGVTLTSALDDISSMMISNSPHQPSDQISRVVCLQLIDLELADSTAVFLITVVFGHVGSVKYEYVTIRVPITSQSIAATDFTYDHILGQFSGALIQSPTVLGPIASTVAESIGVYKSADGVRYIITQSGAFVGAVGGSQSQVVLLKTSPDCIINSFKTLYTDPLWYKTAVGAHPSYGLYATHTWDDNGTKARLRFTKGQDGTEQGAMLTAACESALSSGFTDSFYALSSKSAVGFVLYCSEFPVFMNGRYGVIPTQQIKLTDFITDPANKVFLLYVTWSEAGFAIICRLEGDELSETPTCTLLGTVVTDAVGIISSSIKKVTRLDNFRIDSDGPLEGSSIRTYEILPELEAYIFDSTAEATQQQNTITPDSQATVFSKWDRAGVSAYYPGGVGATGNSAAWTFATNPDRIIQPNNVATIETFASPYKLSDYDFEATLSSVNADNDMIGLVAAFARSNGFNVHLIVWRTGGGITHPNTGASGSNWDFGFAAYNNTTGVKFTPNAYPVKKVYATRGGWSGGHTRVKISRRGNIVKAWCTPWSSSRTVAAYDPMSEISIDLSTIPELNALVGEAAYGYATLSQPESTYYDVAVSGGMDTTRIYDLQTGVVWEYNFSNGAWEATTKTIQDEIGYVRYVTNPTTGYRYVVAKDGVYRLN